MLEKGEHLLTAHATPPQPHRTSLNQAPALRAAGTHMPPPSQTRSVGAHSLRRLALALGAATYLIPGVKTEIELALLDLFIA